MDDDMGLHLEDEDEDVVAEQVHEEEEVEVKEEEKSTIPSNPPTISTGFKPLPMTDASDSWMDDDVGMSMEDEDEEEEIQEQVEDEKETEEPSVADNPKTGYAGLKPAPNNKSKSFLVNLAKESYWSNKHYVEDAENFFFSSRKSVSQPEKNKDEFEDDDNDDDDDDNKNDDDDSKNYNEEDFEIVDLPEDVADDSMPELESGYN